MTQLLLFHLYTEGCYETRFGRIGIESIDACSEGRVRACIVEGNELVERGFCVGSVVLAGQAEGRKSGRGTVSKDLMEELRGEICVEVPSRSVSREDPV